MMLISAFYAFLKGGGGFYLAAPGGDSSSSSSFQGHQGEGCCPGGSAQGRYAGGKVPACRAEGAGVCFTVAGEEAQGPGPGRGEPARSHFLVTGRARKLARSPGSDANAAGKGRGRARVMAEAEAKMKQFNGGGGGAGLDAERGRFPYCVVWTPIPVLT